MISVIVCTYEQPLSIAWLLESLSNQTYAAPLEILIADDGSDAQMLEIIKDASWRFELDIRYLWQPDGGFRLCRSRNNAIRCAQGDLLVFLDGDMVVQPSFLQAHLDAHSSGERVLYCDTRDHLAVRMDRPPENAAELFLLAEQTSNIHPLETESRQQEAWARSKSPWMAISGSNFSVRKAPEVWFNEAFTGWGSEDRDFACRLMKQGYRIVAGDTARGLHVDLVEGRKKQRQNDENREHSELTELIRNKLLLRRLHPDVDTTPALRMLQHCSINPRSNHWSYDPELMPVDLPLAIEAAEGWMDENGIEFRPQPQLGSTTTE